MTDPAWARLRAWKAGDEAAAEALIDEHYPVLARFFRNKVALEGDVADLVHQTMLALVEALDRVDPSRPFRPFLYGIAKNCLWSHLRKQSKRAREAVDFEATCVRDLPLATPSSVVMKRREANALLVALRSIPIADQVMLELKFFEGLTDREIAEITGRQRGSIHRHMTRGLERLRKRVADELRRPSAEAPVDISVIEAWAAAVRKELQDP
ncbi:MAG: sigma-70 family RNA polymerase sigma factor [Myxococcota bacterium]